MGKTKISLNLTSGNTPKRP